MFREFRGKIGKQKIGKFRFSSLRVDMGTAITPLESYELTGFLRIYATTFGVVLKFHDFIPSCSHSRISQILCVKFIVEVRTIVTACFDHQNYTW